MSEKQGLAKCCFQMYALIGIVHTWQMPELMRIEKRMYALVTVINAIHKYIL